LELAGTDKASGLEMISQRFGGAIAKTPTNQPTNRHTYIISGLAEPMKNTKYQIQYMERENMQNPHHVPAAN